MNRFWNLVIEPLLSAAEPRVIVEIGAEAGGNTEHLVEYARVRGAVVHSIDPLSQPSVEELAASHPDTFVLHRDLSLRALPDIDAADAVLIDGDHNWYTVYHELQAVQQKADAAGRALPLVLLHDVGWPYGRRDLYYEPERIPEEYRHPHRKGGIRLGQSTLGDDDGLNPHLENAIEEGGPRNGVLTAVEDFQAASAHDLELVVIEGLSGLGILADARLLERKPALGAAIERLQSSEFRDRWLAELERHRIQTQIRLTRSRSRAGASGERALADLQARLHEAERDRDRFAADRRAALVARDEAERARKEMKIEAEAATADQEGVERRIERAQVEVERAAAAAVDAQAAEKAAEGRVAAAASELRRVQRALREAETERDLLSLRVIDADELERLQARGREANATLERALAEVRAELAAATAAAGELAATLASRQRDLADFAEREREARAQSEAVARERERVRRSLDRAEEAERDARAELHAARAELATLRIDLDAARRHGTAPTGPQPPPVVDDAADLRRRMAERDVELARLAADREELTLRLADLERTLRAALPSDAVQARDDESLEAALRSEFGARYTSLVALDSEWTDPADLDGPLPVDVRGILADAAHSTADAGRTVDIVVCVHNALADVRLCLWSLLAKGSRSFHLIVVNDGSDQQTTDFLRRFRRRHPQVTLLENFEPPFGYTLAANRGMRASRGDYVVLLNSDTIVTPGWIERLMEAGESAGAVGLVGPLSNAASHQSVPLKRDAAGWAVNPLPDWLGEDAVAHLLANSPRTPSRPRFEFLNGFCYGIKREVLDTIGVFDEERFASGYSEENDYSLRATDAGFEIAIADDAYVFHAKSRSFGGAAGRKPIADRNYRLLLEKHGEDEVQSRVRALEANDALEPVRAWLAEALAGPDAFGAALADLRTPPLAITFVLPGMSRGSAGGVHSVYQEASGLRSLGVPARVAMGAASWEHALEAYSDASEVFVPFDGPAELADVVAETDVVVATHYTSVPLVADATRRRRDVVTAYYVQDYEPFFAPAESAVADAALLSYARLDRPLLFAKTHWLCNVIQRLHGLPVMKVEPSIDHDVYSSSLRTPRADGPLRVVAMIRPRTPRRQPAATARVLQRLVSEFGDDVSVTTFGCTDAEMASVLDGTAPPGDHAGLLTREQVAEILCSADVFFDGSIYQAFGRTGLEAMACGATAVLPQVGGVHEFALHERNSLLVDTLDEHAMLAALKRLADDRELTRALQEEARATVRRYSVTAAALSEYALFTHAWSARLGAPARTS